MSGLRKAKKYDWNDSNLALFGSDTEKAVKKSSAETERAWKDAGTKVGVQIWRIVKFKVTHWPKEDYGKFYNGDSYIILNTYKEKDSDELLYDVHFWIGQYSTQDEYGTAAYKTVELDTLLDDKPVQHREVMAHESDLFKTYFKVMELLEGGAETGFRQVVAEKYTPRLLHFSGDKTGVQVKEMFLKKSNLTEEDVFILDLGLEIYQLNGSKSNKDEKFKAVQYLQQLKSDRGGKPKVETVEYEDRGKLDSYLNDEPRDVDEKTEEKSEKILYRLSDEGGHLDFSEVGRGNIGKHHFESKDVFILDTSKEVFVWVGMGASGSEKKNGMTYAHNYLMKTQHPLIPVTVLKEGSHNRAFDAATVY